MPLPAPITAITVMPAAIIGPAIAVVGPVMVSAAVVGPSIPVPAVTVVPAVPAAVINFLCAGHFAGFDFRGGGGDGGLRLMRRSQGESSEKERKGREKKSFHCDGLLLQ